MAQTQLPTTHTSISIPHILSAVFQINTQKPLTVKIFQWFFVMFAYFYFLYFWEVNFPFWWSNVAMIITLISIFICLYLYNLYSLLLVRLLGVIVFFQIIPLLAFFILNFSLTISGIDLTTLNAAEFTEEVQRLAQNRSELISWILFFGWGLCYLMIPFLVAYAFLWGQVDRYKLIQEKLKNNTVTQTNTAV